MNGKGNIKSSLNEKIKYIAGINHNIGIYGSANDDSLGKISAFGDVDTKIGNLTKMDIMFMNINSLNMTVINNLEVNSKTDMKIEDKSHTEKVMSVNSNGVLKTLNRYSINANIYDKDYSKVIVDDNKEIGNDEKNIEFVKKIEKKDEIVDLNKYSADDIKKMLKKSFDELDSKKTFDKFMDAITVSYKAKMTIDVDNNTLTYSYNYDNGKSGYTCTYNYLSDKMTCNGFSETQGYVKGICDSFYQDYLNFEETGECDNEDAEEWEFLYGSLDKCYYETISKSEPTSYKEEFDKILAGTNLTHDDLSVLK